ncbi:hypothetical protein DAMA08_007300 [Martiniozyma asiatica (nom. inval.)]|nr:hypothetical protein DAMA08_007300 [Martiniozyma asiatica]
MNSQSGVQNPANVNILIRLIIVTMLPIILNICVLIIVFPFSCFAGPLFSLCCKSVPAVIAAMAHMSGVFNHLIIFEAIWILEGYNFSRALILLIASTFITRVLFQFIKLALLSREFKEDNSNRAWWSGSWFGLGKYILTQPPREFIVKITEMSLFTADFIIGHLIMFTLTPLFIIPRIDHWHSCLIMWINPKRSLRGPIRSISIEKSRKKKATRYALLYLIMILFFTIIFIVPIISAIFFKDFVSNEVVESSWGLIQPSHQDNNDTGARAPRTIITAKPSEMNFSTFWI